MQSEASLRADSYGDDLPTRDQLDATASDILAGPFRVESDTVLACAVNVGDDCADGCETWVGEMYGPHAAEVAAGICRALNAHNALVAVVKEVSDERSTDGILRRQAEFKRETGLVIPGPFASAEEMTAYSRIYGDWTLVRWHGQNARLKAALALATNA